MMVNVEHSNVVRDSHRRKGIRVRDRVTCFQIKLDCDMEWFIDLVCIESIIVMAYSEGPSAHRNGKCNMQYTHVNSEVMCKRRDYVQNTCQRPTALYLCNVSC